MALSVLGHYHNLVADIDGLAHAHLDVEASRRRVILVRDALRLLYLGGLAAGPALILLGIVQGVGLLPLMSGAFTVYLVGIALLFLGLRGHAEPELLKLNLSCYFVDLPILWSMVGVVSFGASALLRLMIGL